jgi:putative transposase
MLYIQPGKPTQNAYIERFNRTARYEWLDMRHFDSFEQAQARNRVAMAVQQRTA